MKCFSGLSYDLSTCSCVANVSSDISNDVDDNRVARRGTLSPDDPRLAEMIVIVTLAGVAIVFFLIIVNLVITVKNLRRSISVIQSKEVQYYEDHNEEQCSSSLLS